MLIVALVFLVIFLFRDVQILAVQDRKLFALRFSVYAVLLMIGIALFVGLAGTRPDWTERRFALGAILVQIAQFLIGFAFERYALGHHSWIGFVLPSPAFLAALCVLTAGVQNSLQLDGVTAMELSTAAWIAIVGALVVCLCSMNNPWEDPRFASDFALMTNCTALVFVPFGLS